MQPLEHEKIHEKNSLTPILSENEDYFKKNLKNENMMHYLIFKEIFFFYCLTF